MVFNENLNILIVHGGRNDLKAGNYLGDTFILTLQNLEWMLIRNLALEPSPRAYHCAVTYGKNFCETSLAMNDPAHKPDKSAAPLPTCQSHTWLPCVN